MNHPIWQATSMDDLSVEEKAKKAIRHTLERIASHPDVGYHCGVGTGTFGLLTEAFLALHGKSGAEEMEKLRRSWAPQNVRNADAAFAILRELAEHSDRFYAPCSPQSEACGVCFRCVARKGLGL